MGLYILSLIVFGIKVTRVPQGSVSASSDIASVSASSDIAFAPSLKTEISSPTTLNHFRPLTKHGRLIEATAQKMVQQGTDSPDVLDIGLEAFAKNMHVPHNPIPNDDLLTAQQAVAKARAVRSKSTTFRNVKFPTIEELHIHYESIEAMYIFIFQQVLFKNHYNPTLCNLEPAGPVNSLFYFSKYLKSNSLKLGEMDRIWSLIMTSMDNNGVYFTQNGVYTAVMNDLYGIVMKNHIKDLPNLLKQFAIKFFTNRPTSRKQQLNVILALIDEFGNGELDISMYQYDLPIKFQDPFQFTFSASNNEIQKWLPWELRPFWRWLSING
eukprot:NODE_431_length_7570_cov_0.606263.p3 type:complete len:325 gc:universal NODE_431_length_7570_cov_0.606263:7237-6263(-)